MEISNTKDVESKAKNRKINLGLKLIYLKWFLLEVDLI